MSGRRVLDVSKAGRSFVIRELGEHRWLVEPWCGGAPCGYIERVQGGWLASRRVRPVAVPVAVPFLTWRAACEFLTADPRDVPPYVAGETLPLGVM